MSSWFFKLCNYERMKLFQFWESQMKSICVLSLVNYVIRDIVLLQLRFLWTFFVLVIFISCKVMFNYSKNRCEGVSKKVTDNVSFIEASHLQTISWLFSHLGGGVPFQSLLKYIFTRSADKCKWSRYLRSEIELYWDKLLNSTKKSWYRPHIWYFWKIIKDNKKLRYDSSLNSVFLLYK